MSSFEREELIQIISEANEQYELKKAEKDKIGAKPYIIKEIIFIGIFYLILALFAFRFFSFSIREASTITTINGETYSISELKTAYAEVTKMPDSIESKIFMGDIWGMAIDLPALVIAGLAFLLILVWAIISSISMARTHNKKEALDSINSYYARIGLIASFIAILQVFATKL